MNRQKSADRTIHDENRIGMEFPIFVSDMKNIVSSQF
jgi:hypothetical protein